MNKKLFKQIKDQVTKWAKKDWEEFSKFEGGNDIKVEKRYEPNSYITKDIYFGDLKECKNFSDLEYWYDSIAGDLEVGDFSCWLDMVMGLELE